MLAKLAIAGFPIVVAAHSSADSSLETIAAVPDFRVEEETCAFDDDAVDSWYGLIEQIVVGSWQIRFEEVT